MQGLGCIDLMSTYRLICTAGGGDQAIIPPLEDFLSSDVLSGGVLIAILAIWGASRILTSLVKQPLSLAALLVAIFPSREKGIQGLFHHRSEPSAHESKDISKPSAAPPKES